MSIIRYSYDSAHKNLDPIYTGIQYRYCDCVYHVTYEYVTDALHTRLGKYVVLSFYIFV